MKIFFDDFTCIQDIIDNFSIEEKEMSEVEILYACYDNPSYEGFAHVIFVKDGKLYEVNGSHCSCYGLEGQWKPEETLVAALLSRPNVSENAKKNLRNFYKNIMIFI